jgi:excisionase family DNA binding protein
MNHLEFLEKLIILEQLIRREHTGTPDELAERLHISRSTVYEIIEELNMRGVEIKYSRRKCTFYYKNDAFLEVRFNIKSLTEIEDIDELKNISGGCKLFLFRPIFQTEGF